MTAFLVAVGVIFLGAAVCGTVATRLRLPRVVGEMVAGLVLGHSLLEHVWPRAERYLFGPTQIDTLGSLAILAVLLYVAVVGAELDHGVLRGRSRGLLGAAAVGLAAAAGGAAAVGAGLADLKEPSISTASYVLFLTGALLVTAVPVLARILDEAGLTTTRIGTVTLVLSVVDDFIAFGLVAIAIAMATDGSIELAVAGTVLLAAVAIGSKVAHVIPSIRGTPAVSALGIGILALLAGAINSLGASTLVAAFVIGALVWRSSDLGQVPGADAIRVFSALYVVYAALPVDVSRLAEPRLLVAMILVTAVAISTKIVACGIAGRLLSLERSETLGLVVLRNTRGLTELVALNLGYQAGLLSQDLYTVFFSMALLTTAASGVVAMTALRRLEGFRLPLSLSAPKAKGAEGAVPEAAPIR